MMSQVETTRVCARDALITDLRALCREHVEIVCQLPGFPASQPGQFLQLRCGPQGGSPLHTFVWTEGEHLSLPRLAAIGREPFLRRPFSIADRVDTGKGTRLSVISRAIGRGTRWLDALRPGETLNLTGPLGNGFRIPPPDAPVLLVGGGVGIPPLLYTAHELHARGHRHASVIFGATSGDLLPVAMHAAPDPDGQLKDCLRLPGDAPYPAIVTTDDGTLGMRGRVTDAIARLCTREPAAWSGAEVLACGPEPMLAAIARLTRRLGLAAQLCLERYMGCGVGTCLSCVVRTFDRSVERGWRWRLACQDGPVFDRDAVVDYA